MPHLHTGLVKLSLFCILFLFFSVESLFPQAQLTSPDTAEIELPQFDRPIPNPVALPLEFEYAYIYGTRSPDGSPGDDYWQQFAEYDLHATLDPKSKMLHGNMTAVYHNRSPLSLNTLNMELAHNVHSKGVVRARSLEVTDGKSIKQVKVEGEKISEGGGRGRQASWSVNGTQLLIMLPRTIESGETISVEIEWETKIPQQGASGRFGWDKDLFFVGYWYPHFSVFDDVEGWMIDPFQGNAEFYHGFADYNVSITMPDDWVVMATGNLLNAEETLATHVLERYKKANESDEPVAVIKKEDFGKKATAKSNNGKHTWKFSAENVRDVAFSATRKSYWEAARTPVGDLDGDGSVNYTLINAFYRDLAPLWKEMVGYAQHAITFLSELKGYPYPWPHMTAVEGSNIIGGGMEFPMMTIMGDYNARGPMALYSVTAHELAHMWIPMILSTNERRYAWLDEGNTVFATDEARKDFFPVVNKHNETQISYIGYALTGWEGEIMRYSDYHYSSQAYGVATYPKPASVLVALRGVLGEEVFWDAYRTFIREWAWKHPYPFDMWHTFERVSGKDLGWFWRSWYYETWTLNQTVESVRETEEGDTIIVISDEGDVPMPVLLKITLNDGSEIHERVSHKVWLDGSRSFEVTVHQSGVKRVEIDPDRHFPDVERRLNQWSKQSERN